MSKKEQLYYLLEAYHQNKYDLVSFCDELSRILFYESNGVKELNDIEKEYFETLASITERYSPYEDDLRLSKWYVDDKTVQEAINMTYINIVKNRNV